MNTVPIWIRFQYGSGSTTLVYTCSGNGTNLTFSLASTGTGTLCTVRPPPRTVIAAYVRDARNIRLYVLKALSSVPKICMIDGTGTDDNR